MSWSDSLISLDDFQRAARDRLPKALYEYVASGSDDEQTLWENRQVREGLVRVR